MMYMRRTLSIIIAFSMAYVFYAQRHLTKSSFRERILSSDRSLNQSLGNTIDAKLAQHDDPLTPCSRLDCDQERILRDNILAWDRSLNQSLGNTSDGALSWHDDPLTPCSRLACDQDCHVSMSLARTSSVIHVGGQANTWTMRHHVIVLVLKPGLCEVASSTEFNLTSPYKSSALFKYLSQIQAGTMVVGVIGPLTPDLTTTLQAKSLEIALSDVTFQVRNSSIKAFVAMSKLDYSQQKEVDMENGTGKWSADMYIGQPMNVNMADMNMKLLEQRYSTVQADQVWSPPDCQPQSTIAIIIHFRDRESHLRIFLNNLIPFLQRQNTAFHVFVIDQALPELFNRALLMNVGYLEARKRAPFDCYVFHDVDLLPEDACNLYTCSAQPRHLTVAIDRSKYRRSYDAIFGGAIILNDEQMSKIHGFPNAFFGWGGEDDNIHTRVENAGYKRVRYPGYIARYRNIHHERNRDTTNPKSGRSMSVVRNFAKYAPFDGYNTTNYSVVEIQSHKLYTRIIVKVNQGPTNKTEATKYVKNKEKEFIGLLSNMTKPGK